ncbi:MAG: hypothetical protein FJ291_09235 [Planctomycetes bacterium]|nr:hypothetical protein [Planctomycetota bacterium]
MSDKIKETPEHVCQSMRLLFADLEREFSKGADRSAVRMCELSRALSDEADHAFSHPEVWEGANYERALDLLRKCVDAVRGTEYEANCARRPDEFARRISTAREAREALQKIGC